MTESGNLRRLGSTHVCNEPICRDRSCIVGRALLAALDNLSACYAQMNEMWRAFESHNPRPDRRLTELTERTDEAFARLAALNAEAGEVLDG